MKCSCGRKERHHNNECPLWKQQLEHENKNYRPKVGVNVAIVEQCIPIILAFVATQNQQLKEPREENIINKYNFTKGRRMKWDRKKVIH
jgi:hypothetical protein